MQYRPSSNTIQRTHISAIAGAAALIFAPLQAAADPSPLLRFADGQVLSNSAAVCPPPGMYSVINMGQEGTFATFLNERGQAAFSSYGVDGPRNGFFDGKGVHDIGSLGGYFTVVGGLNKHGVVVGQSEGTDQRRTFNAFSWTVTDGMRALPGTSTSSADAINDRGHIAGYTTVPYIGTRAVRWNPNGGVTALGPMPESLSQAQGINQRGITTGFSDMASGRVRASVWDHAGNVTDLGTLGGNLSFGTYINDSNAVAGESLDATGRLIGFFWSRESGMVPINVTGSGARSVAGLNNRGEVVANSHVAEQGVAYQWSLGRGMVRLPSGPATRSDVFDINNKSEMVGLIARHDGEGGGLRAVRWPGLSEPIDLNTRLHRAPAGLVLQAGAAINDDGTILAYSNAGLVMLRPGKRGTDAPVLGPMLGLPDVIELGQDLPLTIGFTDISHTETHGASVAWGDGCPAQVPTVSQAHGVGQVRLQHKFCAAGYYAVAARVTDSGGHSTDLRHEFLVHAPGLASVSGKGTLRTKAITAGRQRAGVPLRFALWAPLGKGTGDVRVGAPTVIFSGPFQFRSNHISRTDATSRQVRLDGTGTLNGRPGYRFALDATGSGRKPDASLDRLRVRITHVDAASGAEIIDYDNGARQKANPAGAADLGAVVDGAIKMRDE